MNKLQQEIHLKDFQSKMTETILNKGNDYANADRLSNFKLAGSISGLSPQLNCLSLIATKVARLGVLLNSEDSPNNESVRDSILDLVNYGALLDMILSETVHSYTLQNPEVSNINYIPIEPHSEGYVYPNNHQLYHNSQFTCPPGKTCRIVHHDGLPTLKVL